MYTPIMVGILLFSWSPLGVMLAGSWGQRLRRAALHSR